MTAQTDAHMNETKVFVFRNEPGASGVPWTRFVPHPARRSTWYELRGTSFKKVAAWAAERETPQGAYEVVELVKQDGYLVEIVVHLIGAPTWIGRQVGVLEHFDGHIVGQESVRLCAHGRFGDSCNLTEAEREKLIQAAYEALCRQLGDGNE